MESSPGELIILYPPCKGVTNDRDAFQYYVRSYAHCEYENGYLVFDCFDGKKEVWRLASDFVDGEPEVAPYAPPDKKQKRTYEFFATIPTHQRYAPRGHFRPWAKLSFPTLTRAYRIAYPTLLCAGMDRAYLHDVRTGELVQTIDIRPADICYVDVNERHVFVCSPEALHVFSRADGNEVLRIKRGVSFSNVLSPSTPTNGDPFVSVLPLHPGSDTHPPIFVSGAWVGGHYPHTFIQFELKYSPPPHSTFVSPCVQGRSRSRDHVG